MQWMNLLEISRASLQVRRQKTQKRQREPPTKRSVQRISLELYFPNLVIRENTDSIPLFIVIHWRVSWRPLFVKQSQWRFHLLSASWSMVKTPSANTGTQQSRSSNRVGSWLQVGMTRKRKNTPISHRLHRHRHLRSYLHHLRKS